MHSVNTLFRQRRVDGEAGKPVRAPVLAALAVNGVSSIEPHVYLTVHPSTAAIAKVTYAQLIAHADCPADDAIADEGMLSLVLVEYIFYPLYVVSATIGET